MPAPQTLVAVLSFPPRARQPHAVVRATPDRLQSQLRHSADAIMNQATMQTTPSLDSIRGLMAVMIEDPFRLLEISPHQ